MNKLIFILGLIGVFVVESHCQYKIIRPTYRPRVRPSKPIIRRVWALGNKPLWLNKGDDVIKAPSTSEHHFLPSTRIIDESRLDPNGRYARSVDSDPDLDGYNNYEHAHEYEHSTLIDLEELRTDQPSNIRHARSLSTPGRGRIGSNDNKGNGGNRGHGSGATHPGYNRRNARSVHLPDFVTIRPFNPKHWPGFPKPERRPRFPIYA